MVNRKMQYKGFPLPSASNFASISPFLLHRGSRPFLPRLLDRIRKLCYHLSIKGRDEDTRKSKIPREGATW